jgi:hypothetical protein
VYGPPLVMRYLSLLIAILVTNSFSAEEYESVFSRQFCAQFLRAEALQSLKQYANTPELAHYKETEKTTLAYRVARRNLSWAQYEALHDDYVFFQNTYPVLVGMKTNPVLVAYFPHIEEFSNDRLHVLRRTLRAALNILKYMGRFFDAYVAVGDHSENYGARPIISRFQLEMAHAFGVSSDKAFAFRTYVQMVDERPRNRLVPTLQISQSDFEALDRLKRLSANAQIPPPLSDFITEYRAFMEGLNLPPTSDIYPLVEILASW